MLLGIVLGLTVLAFLIGVVFRWRAGPGDVASGVRARAFLIGVVFRWRAGLLLDFDYLVKLLLSSFAAGATVGFTLVPVLWIAISLVRVGGRLDDHLIGSAETAAVGMVVGVLLAAMWAIRGYVKTLLS